jgi:hypothetical protein
MTRKTKSRSIGRGLRPRRFYDPSEPILIDFFDGSTLFNADRQIVDWRFKALALIDEIISDPTQPPLKCMACDHAFVRDLPLALGYARLRENGKSMTMPFCAECLAQHFEDIKQRFIARLGSPEWTA